MLVSKGAKTWNRFNKVLHLTQDKFYSCKTDLSTHDLLLKARCPNRDKGKNGESDQAPFSAASYQVLHCLLLEKTDKK